MKKIINKIINNNILNIFVSKTIKRIEVTKPIILVKKYSTIELCFIK